MHKFAYLCRYIFVQKNHLWVDLEGALLGRKRDNFLNFVEHRFALLAVKSEVGCVFSDICIHGVPHGHDLLQLSKKHLYIPLDKSFGTVRMELVKGSNASLWHSVWSLIVRNQLGVLGWATHTLPNTPSFQGQPICLHGTFSFHRNVVISRADPVGKTSCHQTARQRRDNEGKWFIPILTIAWPILLLGGNLQVCSILAQLNHILHTGTLESGARVHRVSEQLESAFFAPKYTRSHWAAVQSKSHLEFGCVRSSEGKTWVSQGAHWRLSHRFFSNLQQDFKLSNDLVHHVAAFGRKPCHNNCEL